ncbi:MAG: hypothetical protein ACTSUK_03955 [Promethearchaeota archaeon]
MKDEKPILFKGKGIENRLAYLKLCESEIQFKVADVDDPDTPFLYYDTMSFYGLKAIELFIKRWHENRKKDN